MRRDRDPIDWLIIKLVGPLFARWHRKRVDRDEGAIDWRAQNPSRCRYCAYTRWVNEEHGQALKIEQHHCVEGNGPPHPLPEAKVIT